MPRSDAGTGWFDRFFGSRQPARWLLERATQRSAETGSSPGELLADFRSRLEAGEPLQYVLGSWSFRGREIVVDRSVLIPRPETEMLVEVVLERLDRKKEYRILDLGTGSGAIAIALAAERCKATVVAIEASEPAFRIALQNVGANRLSRQIEVRLGSWFTPVAGERFDCICSNPPYISTADYWRLDSIVRDFEPQEALLAGSTGLEAYETIANNLGDHLNPGGFAAFEVGDGQPDAVAELLRKAGLSEIEVRLDLAGRERFVIASAPSAGVPAS